MTNRMGSNEGRLPASFRRFGAILVCLAAALSGSSASSADRPAWVWAYQKAPEVWLGEDIFGDRHNSTNCEIRTECQCNFAIQSAQLRLAADFCRVTVFINDSPAFILDDYGPWTTQDITKHLTRGANRFRFECIGSSGPSAILASLIATGVNGEQVTLHSDRSWEGRWTKTPSNLPRDWHRCDTFGLVQDHLWRAHDEPPAITPFDNYEQWKQALSHDEGQDSPKFQLMDGYEIELVRDAASVEGSWVSLEFDPQGRLIIAREDHGLLRIAFSRDEQTITNVEPIPLASALKECRGLTFVGNDLYVNANNSKAMYALRDPDGDGTFDRLDLIREFPGSVGHGRNDLASVGRRVLSIHGDAVELPADDVDDFTSPFREARQGERMKEGYLVLHSVKDQMWTLWSAGLRNPFGVAVNSSDGTVFTYDADAEHDMGAPWYRPTRLIRLQSGADYGWRGVTGQWPPYYPDHADNDLPVVDIGKGSPTAVKFGDKSHFPSPHQDALFILDWAYGRVLAVHLVPRGASYTARTEVFLRGQPLNVTDLDFGPNGAMYLVTGGRKTKSALYRVKRTGKGASNTEPKQVNEDADHQESPLYQSQIDARIKFANLARYNEHSLSRILPVDWHPHMGIPHELENILDPSLFTAAVRFVETRLAPADPETLSLDDWNNQPLRSRLAILLALSRMKSDVLQEALLSQLNQSELNRLSPYEQLVLLRCYSLTLENSESIPGKTFRSIRDHLSAIYPHSAPLTITPVGAGGSVNHRLAELLVKLDAPDVVPKTMRLLRDADTQEDRIHYLFVLRHTQHGWTLDSRREYFRALNDLNRTARGGRGMPGFLKTIREEAVATLSEVEKSSLGSLIDPQTAPLPITSSRLHIREWKLDDIDELLSATDRPAHAENGRKLFDDALCSRCHRCNELGVSVGPDLSSVAQRFSPRDILRSVLDPAAVVAEPYRNVEIVTKEGKAYVGQVLDVGDYRATEVKIQTDPLRPADVTVIPKNDILIHRDSKTSPMPSGLLNTLTQEEILDLLAFLKQR